VTRLLVVGHGLVADRLVDELSVRGALDRFSTTVVGEEHHPAYNRIMLSHILGGDEPDSIVLRPDGWAGALGVRQLRGRWVQRLDTARRTAAIGDGEELAYDVAVLATGAEPVVPPIAGARRPGGQLAPGVHVYRSMDDCLRLREAARRAGTVTVVGGGLLGLEAADVLRRRGCRVEVVHPVPTLLDTQLDAEAGAYLRRAVEARGVGVVTGRAQAALHDPDGTLRALRLDDGRLLATDLVVLTAGVRPRTEVAVASGIAAERGVLVDDRLETSARGVHAIGDCAEHRGACTGLVSTGWEQAACLAARLAGDDGARYAGAGRATRLKVAGIEVAAMGVRDPGPDDEVVTVSERRRQVHRRLIVRDGRLAGATVCGDPEAAATLVGLYDRQAPLPERPVDLFCSTGAFVGGGHVATVCTCNQVDEARIATAIEAGAGSVEAVALATRAGTGCGTCRERIGELVASLAPAPAPTGG
jgi:nitrite reductase (NADH) large subunit